MIPTDSNMSTGEVRRVSRQDIQLVQNLIERCLQLYMNQKEVVETLLVQAKIEPGFTELVWQKLEEENREFFKAYHVRLMVKNQIMIFNKLLEKQVELMHKMCPSGVTSVPNSNGSRSSSMVHQAPCFISEHTLPISRLENMPHPADISSTLLNGGSSTHGNMQSAGDMLLHSGRMDVSPNILPAHTLHMGVVQGVNGDMVKLEPGYADSSFAFGGDGNIMEMRTTVCDASAASFGSVENNSQALHAPLHDTDNSGIGFLGQIPRSFSLSDLTADFSQSSEILESYSRSPFLALEVDEFLDSPGRECHGENKRLDTISEGLSYEEFSSD